MIQIALSLNDTFSKGLVGAARNAKKQGAEISDGMMQAARNADAFRKTLVNAVDASIAKLGKLAVQIGKTAAAFSFKNGSEFEAQMAKVKAVSSPTETQFKQLTDLAKQMGRETQYSALEAAQALESMGRAGWETQEIMYGLPSLLNLTTADDGNLAEFADIMTSAMNSLHMEATTENAEHFANVLAQTSRSSATDVSKMGESFENVAAIAGGLGYKLDDVSFGLGVLAKNGIDASEAGTQMRSLLASLAKPSKEASEYMNSLGISLGEAGKPKALVTLLDELREKTSGLNELEKITFSATLARRTGMTGLESFINTDETTYQELKQKIIYEADVGTTGQGAAAEMAAIMNDTLNAKVKMLKNNVATVGIEFYNAFGGKAKNLVEALNNKLTELTQNGTIKRWAESLGDALNKAAEMGGKAFDWIKEHADALKIVLGGLAVAVGGIWVGDKVSKFINGIQNIKNNVGNLLGLFSTLSAANGLSGLANVFDVMAHPLKSVKDALLSIPGKAANKFSNLFTSLSSGINNGLTQIWELPGKLVTGLGNAFSSFRTGLSDAFGKVAASLTKGFDIVWEIPGKIISGFKTAAGQIAGLFKALPGKILSGFKSLPSLFKSAFSNINTFIGGAFSNIHAVFDKGFSFMFSLPGKIAAGFKSLPSLIGGAFKALPGLLSNIPAIFGGLSGALAASGIIAVILAIVAVGIALYKNWDTIKAKAAELAAKFKENIMPAVEAVKGLFDKFISLIKENFVPLFQTIADKARSLGGSFIETLQPAGEAILKLFGVLAEFFVNNIVPAFSKIIEIACSLAGKFLEVAVPAIAAVIGFVVDLAGKFLEKLQPAVQFVIEKFTALTNFLADVLPPVFEKVIEFAKKVGDFFYNVFCGAIDAVKNAFQRVKETVERVIDKIKDFLGMDARKTVQVDYRQTSASVGQNASGSQSWRGGLTWINERGAEIIRFPNGRTVIPSPFLQRFQSFSAVNTVPPKAITSGRKTLVNLPQGTRIFSHSQSERIVEKSIGRNAGGSSSWRGGLTWLNERGAEIIAFPGGKTIVPTPLLQTAQTMRKRSLNHALHRGEKTLVPLPRGTQIFSHSQSERILEKSIGRNANGAGGSISEAVRRLRERFQTYKKLNLLPPSIPKIPSYKDEIENQKNFYIEREQNESRSVSSVSDYVQKSIRNISTNTTNANHAPVNITIQVYGRANESDRDFAERIAKAIKNYV